MTTTEIVRNPSELLAVDAAAVLSSAHPHRLSLIIPTFNERDNIPTLLAELAGALPATRTEIVFVDDSTDDTPQVIERAAQVCPIPVRVHHRQQATGGLGGAVLEGLRIAQGAWIVVMDADLQHPPDKVLELVATGEDTDADLVVATRYAAGGDRAGLSGWYRRWVSGASTRVTKLVFRRALASLSDPMSGFFAVRAATLDPSGLRPLGYKILLELVVRTRPARVAEVPYTFQSRFAGESKSSLKEGLRFLRHLAVLRLGATRARMLGYAAIGASGLLPNMATLWLLSGVFGIHYLPAAIVANQVAIAWNFALTDLVLFRSRRRSSFASRLSRFVVLGNVDLVVRIPALALLVGNLHLGYLIGNAFTLIAAFLLRFVALDRVIYRPRYRDGATASSPVHHPEPSVTTVPETP